MRLKNAELFLLTPFKTLQNLPVPTGGRILGAPALCKRHSYDPQLPEQGHLLALTYFQTRTDSHARRVWILQSLCPQLCHDHLRLHCPEKVWSGFQMDSRARERLHQTEGGL